MNDTIDIAPVVRRRVRRGPLEVVPAAKRNVLERASRMICLYGTDDVTEILGITSRQLRYWLDQSIVSPEHGADGKGTRRYFSNTNLIEIAIIDDLWHSGIGIELIVRALGLLHEDGYFERMRANQLAEQEVLGIFVLDHREIEVRHEVRIEEFLNGHRALTFVNLKRIERCVAEAIAKRSGE